MIVCTGRLVRRLDNQPTGAQCGAVYPGSLESARVVGWRVGPPDENGARPAMCPSCARPGETEETTDQADHLEPLPGL